MEPSAPNTSRTSDRHLRSPTQAAFTMVEIALSIAIVAFALVAILGVLPTGMKVQKDNREDTIINQDGTFLLEAIRSGSRGLDDLTNYFETITHDVAVSNLTAGTRISSAQDFYTNGTGPGTFSTGWEIIGLLTRPKYLANPAESNETIVTKSIARVRALSGPAGEKSVANREFSFRYQLLAELAPFELPFPTNSLSSPVAAAQAWSLTNNLFELRLTLSWPLFQRGTNWETGNSRKTFRTLVSGYLYQTNIYYFVQSGQFRQPPP